jgi:Bacterial PH domain
MTERSMVDELLRRFPAPVILYPSKRRWLFMLVGNGAFVALGIWMISDPTSFDQTHRAIPPALIAWFGIAFFGLGLIASIVMLTPKLSYLRLDADRLTIRNLLRTSRMRWEDVDDFAAIDMPGPRKILRVGYNKRTRAQRAMGRANMALIGRNSALPDTYGLKAEDLARLMSLWRARAVP